MKFIVWIELKRIKGNTACVPDVTLMHMVNFLKYCPKIIKYICCFEFLGHLNFEVLSSWWLYLAQHKKYLSFIRTKFAIFDDCVPHSFEFSDFFPTFAQLYKAKPQLYTPSATKSMPMLWHTKLFLVRTLQCNALQCTEILFVLPI